MELFFSLKFPLLILVVFFNTALLFLVYRNNKKSATNAIFAVLSMLISFWLEIMYLAVTPVLDLFWTRMSIFIAAPMSLAFFLFALTLPLEHIPLSAMKRRLLYAATGMVMIIAMSPYAFPRIDMSTGQPRVLAGPGMLPFSLLSTAFSVGAVYMLVKKFRKAKQEERRQLQLILSGIGIMLGLIIATIMLPVMLFQKDFFVQFAPLYALVFLGLTAFAILRYHLFDVKVVATEALVTVLVFVLFFEGLLASTISGKVFKMSVAGLVASLGVFLVRSVKKEIRQREEVAQLAASLEKANMRLKELDKQKTEFLSIASHQLRTPLSIIKGYIELIQDGAYGKPTQTMVRILGNMDISNERLVKLVDEFLDISRIEQGRAIFSFHDADLGALVTSVVTELRERAAKKRLSVEWRPPSTPISVRMDEEKIRHVVFNYIDNAIKYSDRRTIAVTLAEERGGVSVRVRDNGVGFDANDQKNFFQQYFRGKNVRKINVDGTGVGIYVCRKFIEGHSGRVWAKSAGPGKGSEFGFWIPLSQATSVPAAA